MTQYVHRITLIVPAQHMDIANHLALMMGESTADIGTFVTADWQDAEGNLYAVCSAVSKPVVLSAITKGLPDPPPTHAVGADIGKAQQALDLLKVYESGVMAAPEHIVLAIDYEPLEAFTLMGISIREDD